MLLAEIEIRHSRAVAPTRRVALGPYWLPTEPSPWETARWLSADDPAKLEAFIADHRSAIAEDRDGSPVYMARDAWELNYTSQRHADIRFTATRERT